MCVGRSKQSGFTLAETLVALALLSILSVLALNAISALQSTTRVERRLDAKSEVLAARNHFSQVLSDIRPVYRVATDGQSSVAFSGVSDKLKLVTVLDDQVVKGGLYEVEYGRSGKTLQISYRLSRGPESTVGMEPHTVLDNIVDFKLRYLGTTEADAKPAWSATWTQTDQLPLAIEISVTFPEGDERTWLPLTVRIATAQ